MMKISEEKKRNNFTDIISNIFTKNTDNLIQNFFDYFIDMTNKPSFGSTKLTDKFNRNFLFRWR